MVGLCPSEDHSCGHEPLSAVVGKVQVVRDLVPSLFRGTYFYETHCQV